MKWPASMNTAPLLLDIGQTTVHAVLGGDTFTFPIERAENGRLTDLSRERLAMNLRLFLNKKDGASGRTAFCAIGARGVSMRRLKLPASSEEELRRVLRLQIESEFPLSPDELAWGSRPIGAPIPSGNGAPARQELLVIAVKKEVLQDYTGVLAACNVTPFFTLAALSRSDFCPPPSSSCAVLDIGRTQAELTTFENGVPANIRILPWGGETITRSIQDQLSISHDEAEKLKLTLDQPGGAAGPQVQPLQAAVESALYPLAQFLKPAALGGKLYLTGRSARNPRLAPLLAGLLGGAACESLEKTSVAGPSAIIAGLLKSTAGHGAPPPLILESGQSPGEAKLARPAVWKWAAAAVLLALAALLFPYAQALVMTPFLEKKLAALQADRGRLVTIDTELEFLQFLKQSQPPYLQTIYLLAKSAPPGMRLESLAMGRHPQISLNLKLGNSQEVSEFRTKLIDSGWFANVIVEEQAPSPDRRMSVRMTADLKPAESRKPLPTEPLGKKSDNLNLANLGPANYIPPQGPMMAPSSPQPISMPPQAAPAPPPNGPPGGLPIRRPRRRPLMMPAPNP